MIKFKNILTESKTIQQIIKEIPNYIDNLECDGATRDIHYILDKNNINHSVFTGKVEHKGETVIPLHYWIQLPSMQIIDFKARMWVGNKAPNGLFNDGTTNYNYIGKKINMPMNDMLFMILTGNMYD